MPASGASPASGRAFGAAVRRGPRSCPSWASTSRSRAWKGIAFPDRRGVELPSDAAIRFFVPLYNLYWAFRCNDLWCNSVNAALARIGDERRASRDLAMIAAAAPFAVYGMPGGVTGPSGWLVNLASYGIWFEYMRRQDELREVVAAADFAADEARGAERHADVGA